MPPPECPREAEASAGSHICDMGQDRLNYWPSGPATLEGAASHKADISRTHEAVGCVMLVFYLELETIFK